jgi:hypothetical protein
MRKLVWGKEKSFEGFKCSGCGWLISNPTMKSKAKNKKEAVAEANEGFAAHRCEDYPLKPKRKKQK